MFLNYHREELLSLSRLFIWEIIVQRLLKVCLPLELIFCVCDWLFPYLSTWLTLSQLATMLQMRHLLYGVFLFTLIRQLLNIYIAAAILQAVLPALHTSTCSVEKVHLCVYCYPRKLIWRLQDELALFAHLVVGAGGFSLLYYIPGLFWLGQLNWRTYMYSQCQRQGCPTFSLSLTWGGFKYGLLFTIVDFLLPTWLPLSVYWSIVLCVDFYCAVAIQNQAIVNLHWYTPVYLTWFLSKLLVVGYLTLSQRRQNGNLFFMWTWFQHAWQRIRLLRGLLLWDEYNIETELPPGLTTLYLRQHLASFLRILVQIRDTLKDYNTPLVALTQITSVPFMGTWIKTLLDPKLEGIASLAKTIDKESLLESLNVVITQLELLLTKREIITSEAPNRIVIRDYFANLSPDIRDTSQVQE